MYKQVFRRSLISAAVVASIGLTACGGSSDSTTATTTPTDPTATAVTLSGKVADGYLENATVCLDLNLNKLCDAGEPTATSTAGGNYSLDATQAEIDAYPVVVKVIAGTTIDEDNPGVVLTQEYTLSAPAGKGAFISPLTTMVQTKIETTGQTAEAVEGEMLASMGQDPAAVSLFDDYVAEKTNTANSTAVQDSYTQLHQIAQVTATTVANNIAVVQAEVDAGTITLDLAVVFDSLIAIIVQEVIAQLEVITTEVEAAATFDADAIATTVDATVDTTTIEDSVAVVEATSNTTATADVQGFFTSGFYWMWSQFASWGNEFEKGAVIDTAGTVSDTFEQYNFDTGTWLTGTGGGDWYLQPTGWVTATGSGDSWDGAAIAYDTAAGTATLASVYEGASIISNVTEVGLAGLNIKQYLSNNPEGGDLATVIDPAAVFTTGSIGYGLTITSVDGYYELGLWDGCVSGDPQWTASGNCNTAVDWTANPAVQITTLAGMLSPIAWADNGASGPKAFWLGGDESQSLQFELVAGATTSSGAVNYYLQNCALFSCTWTKVDTASWDMRTVNGVDLLYVDHPDTLMSQYAYLVDKDSAEENDLFSVQESVVRQGYHTLAGTVETITPQNDTVTNQQAQAEILAALITTIQLNTVPNLGCAAESGVNPLVPGQGGDAPLIAYSGTEFDAVVAACGGALAIDATTLTQGSFATYATDDGGSVSFNIDGTGAYDENGVQIAFTWTIDALTNYITIVGSSFTDVLAAIVIDQFTGAVTFKVYTEESSRGDQVFDATQDGEIWQLSAQ